MFRGKRNEQGEVWLSRNSDQSTLATNPLGSRNVTAARQWISEWLDKTMLGEDQIAEYNGEEKSARPSPACTNPYE